MLLALMMFAIAVLAQQPERPADVTLMKAALGGSCSADFPVKDAEGKPIVEVKAV